MQLALRKRLGSKDINLAILFLTIADFCSKHERLAKAERFYKKYRELEWKAAELKEIQSKYSETVEDFIRWMCRIEEEARARLAETK